MKAEREAQRRLLELQSIDTTLSQLAHRRKTLPEHAEVDQLAARICELADASATAQVGVGDLDRDIARIEQDVEQVRARKDRDQKRLDAGTGPAKELEALMHELGTLNRRQSELEDTELELMERRETAQGALEAIQRQLGEAREAHLAVESRREEKLTGIARDEEFRTAGRASLAADLPTELIKMYERIREQTGGFGAALLHAGRCEGCRLELSGNELAMLRALPADEVFRHEECRRILVRTAESGL